MSERIKRCLMKVFVDALAASIPFGLAMAFYTHDALWLLFCTPILIFLS